MVRSTRRALRSVDVADVLVAQAWPRRRVRKREPEVAADDDEGRPVGADEAVALPRRPRGAGRRAGRGRAAQRRRAPGRGRRLTCLDGRGEAGRRLLRGRRLRGRAQPCRSTPRHPSIAAASASYTAGRARRMASAARVGWTRLVSRTPTSSASGSIQRLVPVKPRCPKVRAPKRAPESGAGPLRRSKPASSEPPGRSRSERREVAGVEERRAPPREHVEDGDPEIDHRARVAEEPGVPGRARRRRGPRRSRRAPRRGSRRRARRRSRWAPRARRRPRPARAELPRGADAQAERRRHLARRRRASRSSPPRARDRCAEEQVAEVAVDGGEALGRRIALAALAARVGGGDERGGGIDRRALRRGARRGAGGRRGRRGARRGDRWARRAERVAASAGSTSPRRSARRSEAAPARGARGRARSPAW